MHSSADPDGCASCHSSSFCCCENDEKETVNLHICSSFGSGADMRTHSLTIGPPDFSCNILMISLPFTSGFNSHTFSNPASSEREFEGLIIEV